MPEVQANHWHAEGRIKRCIRCGEGKPLTEFYAYGYVTRQGKQSTRYDSLCRSCAKGARREAYATDPARDNAVTRKWREANRDRIASYNAQRQQDPEHRRNKAKAQRLRKARLRTGQQNDPAIKAVYAEAMRVESLIQCCPVFDLPELGKKIHVDHIIPLAKGGKHVASNLQLLPIGLNMRKGVQCPR